MTSAGTVHHGIQAVRHRPMMFIGSTDEQGLHGVLDELLAVCFESVLRGCTQRIDLTIHPDGSAELGCDGPGFLTGSDGQDEGGLPFAFNGSIYTNGIPDAWGPPRVSMTRFGPVPFCALCAYLEATSRSGALKEEVRFERGEPVPLRASRGEIAAEYGTYLRWLPDPEIFGRTTWDGERLKARLRTLACLVPGVEIRFADLARGEQRQYRFPNGVADLAALLIIGREPLHPPIRIEHQAEWGELSAALQYHSWWDDGELVSFANHYLTSDGSHTKALRLALVDAVNAEVQESPYPLQEPGARSLGWPEVSIGLRAVVSVRLFQPLWVGAMRDYLANRELLTPFREAIAAGLAQSRAEAPGLWSEVGRRAASSVECRPKRERSLRVVRRPR